jgi:hypothetical protein
MPPEIHTSWCRCQRCSGPHALHWRVDHHRTPLGWPVRLLATSVWLTALGGAVAFFLA